MPPVPVDSQSEEFETFSFVYPPIIAVRIAIKALRLLIYFGCL